MKHKITIEFDDEADALSAGLRVSWLDGEDSKNMIHLSCGAGVRSPFMIFSIKDKGTKKTRYAVADIRPVVKALVRALA